LAVVAGMEKPNDHTELTNAKKKRKKGSIAIWY